jgi:hypothetical protein
LALDAASLGADLVVDVDDIQILSVDTALVIELAEINSKAFDVWQIAW